MTEEVAEAEAPTLEQWGAVARLARGACRKALEVEKDRRRAAHVEGTKFKFDNLAYTMLVYTNDETTARLLQINTDLQDICGVSAVDGVCLSQDGFPPDATAAETADGQPKIAVLLLKSTMARCERCWLYTAPAESLCQRCNTVVNGVAA